LPASSFLLIKSDVPADLLQPFTEKDPALNEKSRNREGCGTSYFKRRWCD